MNSKLIKYVEFAKSAQLNGNDINHIIADLRNIGATLAITIKTLEKLGFNIDDLDHIIDNSEVWKDSNQTFEDLFFEFAELDDDVS